MTLSRAISNLRQLHGFGMKSESELRRVERAVLNGDVAELILLACHGEATRPVGSHEWTVAVTLMAERFRHLIREASGDEVG